MIFEIFELINFDHVHKAFSNLNIRFQNLLADSKCSIKFRFGCISKSTFQHYYTEIIQPNKHRIKSLYLSNTFIINHILTSIDNASKLLRLETLNVNNIFSKYIDELFQCLSILPVLSKLTIYVLDYMKDKAKFYCQILGISGLKYCKITLQPCDTPKSLSITSNTSSSIEHLVINDSLHINTFMALLPYIPHLRHLTVHDLCRPSNEQLKSCLITFNQLTYIDFYVDGIVFNDFILLIRKFSPRLDTLRLSTANGKTYLDGKKWQELILSDMPCLRIFDLSITADVRIISEWQSLYPSFKSSFYFDQQWFFAYQSHGIFGEQRIFFYSTDPYK